MEKYAKRADLIHLQHKVEAIDRRLKKVESSRRAGMEMVHSALMRTGLIPVSVAEGNVLQSAAVTLAQPLNPMGGP